MDKKPAPVRRKSRTSKAAAPAAARGRGTVSSRKKPASRKTPSSRATAKARPGPVEFTNVDKVWFPAANVTKGDVLKYYLGVADKLLPHLRDRPITLERMPDGVGEGKPRFWQKNTPDYYPGWIPRFELPSEQGKRVQYALVNDEQTLTYLVNQRAITFHPFLSRVQDLDHPDFVLFDLDPGGAKFADVVRIAKALHFLLDQMGKENFVKTSGKSGLHV